MCLRRTEGQSEELRLAAPSFHFTNRCFHQSETTAGSCLQTGFEAVMEPLCSATIAAPRKMEETRVELKAGWVLMHSGWIKHLRPDRKRCQRRLPATKTASDRLRRVQTLEEAEITVKKVQSGHSEARLARCSEGLIRMEEKHPPAFSAMNQCHLGESRHPISVPLQR